MFNSCHYNAGGTDLVAVSHNIPMDNSVAVTRSRRQSAIVGNIVSCRVVSCRVVSCRVVSCRVVSRRVASSVVSTTGFTLPHAHENILTWTGSFGMTPHAYVHAAFR